MFAPTNRFRFGKASLAKLATVSFNLQCVVRRALVLTAVDFAVHTGARTAEEQNALYQIGRTKPGKKVTDKDGYKNKSNHQVGPDGFGFSVDLVPFVGGKLVWDWDHAYEIARAMSIAAKEQHVILRWGGNWYQTMDQYGDSIEDLKASVEWYKKEHPGPDMIDGPHFELVKSYIGA